MAVQVDQAAKDLPRPPLQNLWVDVLVPLPVSTRHAQVSATRGWQESGVSRPTEGEGCRALTGAVCPT